MPRVVPDQREKFENDELFRKLSRESEVRYTGYRNRPLEERRLLFQDEVREGHADIAFVIGGTNLQLFFLSNSWSDRADERRPTPEFIDFNREPGRGRHPPAAGRAHVEKYETASYDLDTMAMKAICVGDRVTKATRERTRATVTCSVASRIRHAPEVRRLELEARPMRQPEGQIRRRSRICCARAICRLLSDATTPWQEAVPERA
ncbi:hypothetical protein LSH36_690g01021 [Paralvinella palmiformis]|uniref:Uncharacterized protein n=1 Tax=Paralvinella palmiformis TaxID=53620 RepID=A0AAD9J2T5_9ANNE|nr:hypothetical protein LSH36_690g01021 [Paralvinella palmiformis]